MLLLLLPLLPRALASTESCNASDQVISLPIMNVTLSNNQQFRGVPIEVGTPPQTLAMMPQPWLNDTWLYNTTAYYCNASWTSPNGCLTNRGGLYDPLASTSRENATSVIAAGADPNDTLREVGLHIWDGVWGNDKLTLGNISLPDYPIGMPGFPIYGTYDTQSNFGMGFNSTLLNALKATKAISRRAYSWWWGVTGAITNTNGQIVFGGYDAAKVQGPNYTKPLQPPTDPGCYSGMVVSVTDVFLTFPNSTQISLTDGVSLSTCIRPDFTNIMQMPYEPTYDNFETATQTQNIGRVGGNGIDFYGVGYWPGDVYQGSLTIEIDSKMQFTFPNELLVKPPTYVGTDGSLHRNETVREVVLDPYQGSGPTILGRLFFQIAYLMVDYDANTFTLWNANTTSTQSQLIINGSCSANTTVSTTAEQTGATSSSQASTASNSSSSSKSASSPTTAQVAGAAVAGVCIFIVGAAAAVYYLLKRRAKANEKAESERKLEISRPQYPPQYYQGEGYPGFPIMHEAMSHHVNELYAQREPAELMPCGVPFELDSKRKTRELSKKPYWNRKNHHSVANSPVEMD